MDKKFWGILGGLVIIAIVVAIIFGGNSSSTGSNNVKPTNHIRGQGSTGVKLVEYGDYQCPACGTFYPTVEQVFQKYKDRIYYQFRNYPLPSLHPNAIAGARAAEAAGLQGKYWQMYNKLYSENVSYYQSGETLATWINADDPLTYFANYAKDFGLNVAKFKKDYKSSKVNDKIQADRNKGDSLNIQGTPSFFLDGKKINVEDVVNQKTNAPSLEKFVQIIDKEIEKKTGHKVQESPADQSGDTSGNKVNTEPLQTPKQ